MTLTLFQFLQHRPLEIIRCTTLQEQPPGQRTMVERPEHVLIVRISIQREHGVQQRIKVTVRHVPLTAPHQPIQVLCDQLGGLIPPRFEPKRECIRQRIRECSVRFLSLWIDECRLQCSIRERLELEKPFYHRIIVLCVFDNACHRFLS